MSTPRPPHERAVRDSGGWFTFRARYWRDVYNSTGVEAQIYRDRLATVLRLVDDPGLDAGSAVLDAGCGAGQLIIECARRGARVVGSDLSREMTQLARAAMETERLDARIVQADASRLPFPDSTFDWTFALGLLPWVVSEQAVMAELTRVTRPGGHVLLTFDNAIRLSWLADPLFSPITRPIRRIARALLRIPPRGNQAVSPRRAHAIVRSAGLSVVRTAGVGFGPPTMFGRAVLRGSLAVSAHALLQRRAMDRAGRLERLGAHYLVLARR